MTKDIQEIFLFITSPELQEKIFPIKVIFISVSVVLTFLIAYLLKVSSWWKSLYGKDLEEFRTYKAFGTQAFIRRWRKITRLLKTATPSEVKLALIEADSLLEEVLERMGYTAPTLGERLKQLKPDDIPNLDALWEAHRIRNNIVHDPDYRLPLGQAKKAINAYEQAFKGLDLF